MIEGWVFLHKKILSWEWYSDANTFRLFMHLLLNANYEDKKWMGILIKRGDFVTSREQVSRKLKLSASQIRTSEVKLKLSENLAIETTNKFVRYSIIKYDDYQDPEKIIASKITNESQSNRNQIATTKEKEVRKKESKEVREVAPPSKKLIKMPFDLIPLDWKAWLIEEKGWPEEVLQDFWSIFREYWQNGKGGSVKREEWTSTFKTWMRKEKYNSAAKCNVTAGQSFMSFEEKAKHKTDLAIEEARKRYE